MLSKTIFSCRWRDQEQMACAIFLALKSEVQQMFVTNQSPTRLLLPIRAGQKFFSQRLWRAGRLNFLPSESQAFFGGIFWDTLNITKKGILWRLFLKVSNNFATSAVEGWCSILSCLDVAFWKCKSCEVKYSQWNPSSVFNAKFQWAIYAEVNSSAMHNVDKAT